jgi:hypothetical protein
MRSSGGKLVTFQDESQRQQTGSTKRPKTAITTVQSKPKYDQSRPSMTYGSDDEKTNTSESDTDQHIQPTRSGVVITEIQPPPRKKSPTAGVSALVPGSTRPSTVNITKTVPTIVRPTSTFKKYESDR